MVSSSEENKNGSLSEMGIFEYLFKKKKKVSVPVFIAYLLGSLYLIIWIFHIYSAKFGIAEVYFHRFIHFILFLILLYLTPFKKTLTKNHASWKVWINVLPVGASFFLFIYFLIDPEGLSDRGFLLEFSGWDYCFSVILILLVLEGCRRTIGYTLMLLTLFFIIHTLNADIFPGFLKGQEASFKRLLGMLTLLPQDGIFGLALEIMSTYVILFILFGSFLVRSGVSDVFINGAFAITGKKIAGPAKASIFTSAAFGTVSGSAVANVNVDGIFTIPLMKKVGFSAETASAIEAVTSTGGQIMPPVMAAAGFLMAGFLGLPYATIAGKAIIPALLYFISLYFMVHFEGRKLGLTPLKGEDFLKFRTVIKKDGYLLIPLVVIIVGLVKGYTVMHVVFWAIVATFLLSFTRKGRALNPVNFLISVEEGVQTAISLVVAFACAGIIIGCVSTSGVGLSFSSVLIKISGNSLIVALLLTMIAAFVLGMGLGPATVYVVLVSLVVPALVKLGCNEIAAHFFIFYFGCFAVITPPVCLATYAAAGIGHADPWKAGWEGMRVGIAAYIIPYMFVFGPSLLLVGSWASIISASITAAIGAFFLAVGVQGWLFTRMKYFARIMSFVAAILLIKPGLYTDIIGMIIIVTVVIIQRKATKAQIKSEAA